MQYIAHLHGILRHQHPPNARLYYAPRKTVGKTSLGYCTLVDVAQEQITQLRTLPRIGRITSRPGKQQKTSVRPLEAVKSWMRLILSCNVLQPGSQDIAICGNTQHYTGT